jgi:hypothetical protein
MGAEFVLVTMRMRTILRFACTVAVDVVSVELAIVLSVTVVQFSVNVLIVVVIATASPDIALERSAPKALLDTVVKVLLALGKPLSLDCM